MSSIWQWRRVLQAPRDVSIAYENKAGTHTFCWFSFYFKTLYPKYLQIKHYESILMTIWILHLFALWMLNRLGKSQTNVYATIWLEDSFGSLLGWDHTVRVEKKSFCVHSLVIQHWLSKELSTVPLYALCIFMVIFHSLTENFQPWGIKSTVNECLGFQNSVT